MPFGGKTQLTPAIAMAAKICGGETDVATVSAYGYCSKLMSESPFTGAIYSIVTSVAKLIAAGCDFDAIRLTFQEYFMRLNRDPKRWGVPCPRCSARCTRRSASASAPSAARTA